MWYLIVTSMIWAFSYGLIKVNLGTLDPNFITFCRMLMAALVFMPFLKIKQLSPKAIISLLAIGSIQYGLMYLCFLRSFKYLDAHQAALFTTMTPLYVILVHNIWHKKISLYYLGIALLAVAGGIIIYYQEMQQAKILTGFWLVQASDVCFAFGQVAYKRFHHTHKNLKNKNIYAILFIGAILPAAIATTIVNSWDNIFLVTNTQLVVLGYLGAIASGLCFFLWNKGALMVNTATLAVVNNLKSPLAIAVSLIFFNESTNLLRLTVGLTIIGSALYITQKRNYT
jgi:drug/metabolite transporter (DMT)-like permease